MDEPVEQAARSKRKNEPGEIACKKNARAHDGADHSSFAHPEHMGLLTLQKAGLTGTIGHGCLEPENEKVATEATIALAVRHFGEFVQAPQKTPHKVRRLATAKRMAMTLCYSQNPALKIEPLQRLMNTWELKNPSPMKGSSKNDYYQTTYGYLRTTFVLNGNFRKSVAGLTKLPNNLAKI